MRRYLIASEENLAYLAHHGIQGQKWGIRRFQNEDGSRTSLGRQHENNTSNLRRLKNASAIGSAARVRQKQQMFENKINKSNDKNIVTRNILNDLRRGRIAQLKTKAEHREAKNHWRRNKNSENLKQLRSARLNRVGKNGIFSVVPNSRGTYNRYRNNGGDIAKSVLKTAGKVVATGAAIKVGERIVNNLILNAVVG